MIGFTPEQGNRMTFWEFSSAVSGWMRANGGKPKVEAPSGEELEEAIARH